MNITMEKDAASFIKKYCKDNSITLLIKSSGNGWCSAPTPSVLLGKPTQNHNYIMYTIDDINIFIRDNIKTQNNELHIFLRKFLWIKELAVDGMKINY